MVSSRRKFLKESGILLGGALVSNSFFGCAAPGKKDKAKVILSAHLWVYASAFPPRHDATPVFDTAFSDLQASGVDGIELMAVNLMNEDAVENIGSVAEKYNLPITGTSFGGNMWNSENHQQILGEAQMVISRLSELKGKTFGISVGNANRMKTEAELDSQAELLKKIFKICEDHNVVPNLHNHTYEVANDMHDLRGTLARIPDANLGPDLNWLIRGGVDPVSFINEFGSQIVFLHIRDQFEDGTWTEYVGQGVTDFPAIANALKEKNFQGHAAIELAYPRDYVPQNTMNENWRLSAEYVKEVFGW